MKREGKKRRNRVERRMLSLVRIRVSPFQSKTVTVIWAGAKGSRECCCTIEMITFVRDDSTAFLFGRLEDEVGNISTCMFVGVVGTKCSAPGDAMQAHCHIIAAELLYSLLSSYAMLIPQSMLGSLARARIPQLLPHPHFFLPLITSSCPAVSPSFLHRHKPHLVPIKG